MACDRSPALSLASTFDTWLRTVFGVRKSSRAIVGLSRPWATSSKMSISRRLSCGNGHSVAETLEYLSRVADYEDEQAQRRAYAILAGGGVEPRWLGRLRRVFGHY